MAGVVTIKRISRVLLSGLLLAASFSGAHAPTWVRAETLARPQENEEWISDTFFLSQTNGWIVLNNRIVLATSDGGKTWEKVHEGDHLIGDLQFASPLAGWAVSSGSLLGTANGGRTWQVVTTSGISGFERFDLARGRPAWASYRGTIYRSTDGGKTWMVANSPYKDAAPLGPLSFVDLEFGWVICRGEVKGIGWMDKTLFRTTNAGRDWQAIAKGGMEDQEGGMPGGYVGDLFFFDQAHGWYSQVRHGGLFATVDGGTSWRKLPELNGHAVQHISMSSPTTGSAVELKLARYRLLTTDDGGSTWVQRYATRPPAGLRD